MGAVGAVVLVVMGVRTLTAAQRVRLGLEVPSEVVTPARALRTSLAATASNPLTIASWATAFAAASTASVIGGWADGGGAAVRHRRGQHRVVRRADDGVLLAGRRLGDRSPAGGRARSPGWGWSASAPCSASAPSATADRARAWLPGLDVTARRYSPDAMPPKQNPFRMVSEFAPAGDQPKAIAALSEGIANGERYQTLLGITGSGKSATIAWTIEQVQKPTLVIAPNKSLAAQLANEFREFFPDNRVEYFVSYYDYYQPEAYIASTDTYIEKDSSINDEIDRLRHSATAALLTRRDVIVVASVSCIYGLGSPEEYRENVLFQLVGDQIDQRAFLRQLVDMQYDRNDTNLDPGQFRVRGDTIEVHPAYEETILRIELFGDEIERITEVDPLTGEQIRALDDLWIYPATHYVAGDERMQKAIGRIEAELAERLPSSRRRASCSRPSASACAPSTTSR